MKKINFEFNKLLLVQMICSLIFIVYGIFGIYSTLTTKSLAIIFGILLILNSVFEFISYYNKKRYFLYQFSNIMGISYILIGLFAIFYPKVKLEYLGIASGLFLIVNSVNKYMIYTKLKTAKEECAHIYLLSALVIAFMGIINILNPFSTMAITTSTSILLIVYSVLNISNLVLIKNRSKKLLKSVK